MLKKEYKILSVLAVASFLSFGYWAKSNKSNPWATESSASVAIDQAPEQVPLEEAFPYVMQPKSTFFNHLRQLGVSPAVIHEMVVAAKPVQNLGRLRPGIRFQLFYNEPEVMSEGDVEEKSSDTRELVGLTFRFSPIDFLSLRKVDQAWVAERIEESVDIRVENFTGSVESSLWESARKSNMDPQLISELADIFGWEVDFSREVRLGDKWRLAVEKKIVKGEFVGWGSILAAEYVNGDQPYQAVLFRHEGEDLGYFNAQGDSLRKLFLKSPIRYGRISSGFSRNRFHPILKERRPHLGVDYAAPIGTPIRAVGQGTVTFANWSGGGGKVIKIRHNSTYETAYKHLNGFARGIKSGTKVQQGQVIGYVGTTGLSTGPHLHFEFFQGGRYIDPLSKRFPSADPVPKDLMQVFSVEAGRLLALLPGWSEVVAKN